MRISASHAGSSRKGQAVDRANFRRASTTRVEGRGNVEAFVSSSISDSTGTFTIGALEVIVAFDGRVVEGELRSSLVASSTGTSRRRKNAGVLRRSDLGRGADAGRSSISVVGECSTSRATARVGETLSSLTGRVLSKARKDQSRESAEA